MISSRHNPIATATALVYLCATLGGGLHRHDDGEAFARCRAGCSASPIVHRTIEPSSPIVSTHEDADGCALCTALHQAKALFTVLSLGDGIAAIGEAPALPIESPIPSIGTIQNARAPPSLSHFTL
jgi:hypothetical protein